MGKDNQPKERQKKDLARKRKKRSTYDRILIVCEGTKTEPKYFKEIQVHYRLQTANVQVEPSRLGTSPRQVVEYARDLFLNGHAHKGIQRKSFEQIFAVFDRDDHANYHEALQLVASLDGKLRNDLKKSVVFRAIASVPCFELWLLLHYEEIHHPIHRDEVQHRLKNHIPEYEKGAGGYYELTRSQMAVATQRARSLADQTTAYDGQQPYTDVDTLANFLVSLGKRTSV